MEFTSAEGERRCAALVRAAASTVVGLDFDGTLSPIVDDPAAAHIHPDASDVLVDLAAQVAAVAVITGRPARQALDLGGLEEVGHAVGDAGKELYLFGQYGNERWTSTNRRVISPRPPHGLASFLRDLPRLLRRADAEDAYVEEKGLAVAVHTRRLAGRRRGVRPAAARDLRELAERHDLVVEPGRNVIEVRSPGMHKGLAVGPAGAGGRRRRLPLRRRRPRRPRGVRGGRRAGARTGMPTLLVCSASEEESALVEHADVVVKGPEGVLDLLRQLTAEARDLRA